MLHFWAYLLPVIPSIICSIFLLYHLLMRRELRTAIHVHVIILMISFGLFYEITNIVWYLHFYRTGNLLSATPIFCRIWVFIDGGVYVIVGMLMAWGSVERHILIFHRHWLGSVVGKALLHYLPLAFCSIYPTLFYGLIFFILPCDVPFDYTTATCGYYSCISWNSSLSFWDSILNFVLPSLIIVIFSVTLFVRIIYQRCRMHRRIEWRHNWKMAAQLLSISVIYFVFLLPAMSLNTAYTVGLPWDGGSDVYWAWMYLGYYTVLLTPFVCVLLVPEVSEKLQKSVWCCPRRTIVPIVVSTNPFNKTPVPILSIVRP